MKAKKIILVLICFFAFIFVSSKVSSIMMRKGESEFEKNLDLAAKKAELCISEINNSSKIESNCKEFNSYMDSLNIHNSDEISNEEIKKMYTRQEQMKENIDSDVNTIQEAMKKEVQFMVDDDINGKFSYELLSGYRMARGERLPNGYNKYEQ